MTTVPELRTERLLLREWREADREPFAEMNADPAVMEYFPALMSRADSDAYVDRIIAGFAEHGFGLWAVEVLDSGEFIGFDGLAVPTFEAPFLPGVEIGWRLRRSAWGQGYATEAARAALSFGFDTARLDEIVSYTTVRNARSRAVMERIGMRHDPDGDFIHPRVPPGHPVGPHVLYRITRQEYAESPARNIPG